MDPQQINLKQASGTQAGAQAGTQGATATGGTQTAVVLDHANNLALSEKIRNYWKEVEAKYVIPRLVREKYPDLIHLIKETESMNNEEREYWFQILPIMTEDQIQKFVGILDNEKQQLQKLDTEYEKEISQLNDKHKVEWNAFEAKKQKEAIQEQEQAVEAQETQKEEDLLKQLNSL